VSSSVFLLPMSAVAVLPPLSVTVTVSGGSPSAVTSGLTSSAKSLAFHAAIVDTSVVGTVGSSLGIGTDDATTVH